MEARFTLGRQSSLAPDRNQTENDPENGGEEEIINPGVRLMYSANEGDLDGIKELLDSGTDVNFRDIDDRTALHVSACQGSVDVVKVLLERGSEVDPKDRWGSTIWMIGRHCYVSACQGSVEVVKVLLERGSEVDPKDRWGSTPLADAIHYKNREVIKLLEKHGAKPLVAPMHVRHAREVPEYEIDPKELDFTNSVELTKGTFMVASWRGTRVAVKKLGEVDEDRVGAFRDELALLQRIRHPNVVQFLGAVTQSSPMMIVTEYLPKGDLRAFLDRTGALKPMLALKCAMDIARGLNYLHENKPEAIIHRDLEPSNILRDDSGHLKVADFGVSKLLTKRENKPILCHDSSCRYVAPEVFRNEEYDTKVDVFSFALILQEMIEGCVPFSTTKETEVPKLYAAKERPPFKAPAKFYAHGLKQLIEECWSENASQRPTFKQIIPRLESIFNTLARRQRWKVRPMGCFQRVGAMWKKDSSDRSKSSHSSSTNTL